MELQLHKLLNLPLQLMLLKSRIQLLLVLGLHGPPPLLVPVLGAPPNTAAGGNSSMPWFHATDFGTEGNAVEDDANDGQEDEDETF